MRWPGDLTSDMLPENQGVVLHRIYNVTSNEIQDVLSRSLMSVLGLRLAVYMSQTPYKCESFTVTHLNLGR